MIYKLGTPLNSRGRYVKVQGLSLVSVTVLRKAFKGIGEIRASAFGDASLKLRLTRF